LVKTKVQQKFQCAYDFITILHISAENIKIHPCKLELQCARGG